MNPSDPFSGEHDPDCECHVCIAVAQWDRDSHYVDELRRTLHRLAQIIREHPSLWMWGDGEGGWLYDEMRNALENHAGVAFAKHEWKPRSEVQALADRDGWCCAYCSTVLQGAPDRPMPHVDHVVPRSRGGGDGLSNKVLACPSCNCSKGSRTPDEWREWLSTRGGQS